MKKTAVQKISGNLRAITLTGFVVAVGFLCSTALSAQASGGSVSLPTLEGVSVRMRDGRHLKADIYLPSKPGRYPTILIITPYNRKLIGAAIPDPRQKKDIFFDRETYAIAVVDWRGFFGSKGAAAKAEVGKDGYDTVEWVARQRWSDGKVGMWGPSALGKVQFYTAIENPPHLVCGVPMVAEYGYSYDQFYHGGVLKKSYVDTLKGVGFNIRRITGHPVKDKFWQTVASMRKTEKIDIPLLIITGWYDLHTEGIIDTFEDIRKNAGAVARNNTRLLIGPWDHANIGKVDQGDLKFAGAKAADIEYATRFFDYWLRDKKDNGWKDTPPIRYYQIGSDNWLTASSWPPAQTVEAVYTLQDGGRLGSGAADPSESKACFRYDPKDPSPTVGGMTISKFWDSSVKKILTGPRDQKSVKRRGDLLAYTSKELKSDLVMRGAARVRLHVSSDRKDTDFAVRLVDEYPDGRSILVSDGIQRMRFRDKKVVKKFMKPGKVYPVEVVLSMTAYTFLKGHRISILISSSNYPRFDINTNMDRRRLVGPHKPVANNCVHRGGAYPSALILPSIENREDKGAGLLHRR